MTWGPSNSPVHTEQHTGVSIHGAIYHVLWVHRASFYAMGSTVRIYRAETKSVLSQGKAGEERSHTKARAKAMDRYQLAFP